MTTYRHDYTTERQRDGSSDRGHGRRGNGRGIRGHGQLIRSRGHGGRGRGYVDRVNIRNRGHGRSSFYKRSFNGRGIFHK